jgi:membrane AbrB-like protein
MRQNKESVKALEAAGVGIAGGLLFMFIHAPLPWMLGPLTAVTVWRLTTRRSLYWPFSLRQTSLAIFGYMLGRSFTNETILLILKQLPYMAVTTVMMVMFSLSLGVWVARRANIGTGNGIFGSVPGGLAQMLVISEETEKVETTVVALMQSSRVIAVVFLVPFLAIHAIGTRAGLQPPSSPLSDTADLSPYGYGLFAAAVIIGVWAAKRIRLPNHALTGALLTTAIINVSGIQAPPLPSLIVLLAQLSLGIYIGLQMKPDTLGNARKLVAYTAWSSLLLVLFCLLLAFLLTIVTPMDLTTAFLSAAPGGIAEMGVTAAIIGADLSFVTGYQLFRLFFIMFAVLPLLQWWFNRKAMRRGEDR